MVFDGYLMILYVLVSYFIVVLIYGTLKLLNMSKALSRACSVAMLRR